MYLQCCCLCTNSVVVYVPTVLLFMYLQCCCLCTNSVVVYVLTVLLFMYLQCCCSCTYSVVVHVPTVLLFMYLQCCCSCTYSVVVHVPTVLLFMYRQLNLCNLTPYKQVYPAILFSNLIIFCCGLYNPSLVYMLLAECQIIEAPYIPSVSILCLQCQ